MINLVEKALHAHQSVTPTIFVDDLAAESAGPDGWIKAELGGFYHHRRRLQGEPLRALRDEIACHGVYR